MITFTTRTNYGFIGSRKGVEINLTWIMQQADRIIRIAEFNTLREVLVQQDAPAEWLEMVEACKNATYAQARSRKPVNRVEDLYDIGAY